MDDASVGMSALGAMPLFAGVNEHDLRNILKIGELRSFEPGQAIVERGEPGDAMYIVLRGIAQVDVGGRFHDIKTGEFFGEMALVAGRKRMATVKATDPDVVAGPNGKVFVFWADNTAGQYEIYYATSADYGVTWSVSRALTNAPQTSGTPRAAASQTSGKIGVAWRDMRDGNDEIYFADGSL